MFHAVTQSRHRTLAYATAAGGGSQGAGHSDGRELMLRSIRVSDSTAEILTSINIEDALKFLIENSIRSEEESYDPM